jgi:hypothetical protein
MHCSSNPLIDKFSRHVARREPGVENMLGHAPAPLTASGLDMRAGHPAEPGKPYLKRGSHAPAPSAAQSRMVLMPPRL